MAKVYESDVDPDEFIRSFREEPSGVSSLKKRKSSTADAVPEQQSSLSQITVGSEEDFSNRFVRNMAHMRPQQKYLMVEISPEFIRTIKRILSYEEGPACSVKAYVNNVLAEHFTDYAEIIKKRL